MQEKKRAAVGPVLTLLLLLGSTLYSGLQAQSATSIFFRPSPSVDRLFEAFVEQNRRSSSVPGWRVQILATTDRQRMEQTRQRFAMNYPTLPISYVHTKPYYKLRAGAFESKAEAERLKQLLDQEFAGVYLVRDEIPIREIIGFGGN